MAGEYLAKYTEDKVDAMKELVNLVLKSAGCDLQVNDDDVQDEENVGGRLGELQEEYQAVSLLPTPDFSGINDANLLCSKILPSTLSFRRPRVATTSELTFAISSSPSSMRCIKAM